MLNQPKRKIIGIIGPPGSGKTTLGKRLSAVSGFPFLEEDWKGNPFVFGAQSINARPLDVSLGFLEVRKRQCDQAIQLAKAGKVVIMDTVFDMTDVYSQATLDRDDYQVFKEIFDRYAINLPLPDLIICLSGPPDLLMKRANERKLGIHLEKSMITAKMIEKCSRLIDSYLNKKSEIPIIRVDVSKTDIRDSDLLRDLLIKCNI